ncbi:MAG: alginate export family protein [Melioribacteraceae bacterium]|nr:alginate export family protein [Melioribacteraceae bacterium]MCF8355031.1 alginate export family protein [Melioribacteraceae bacterium]MCF8392710.1 alginate export family protein [Melioribacteraceae bacterium]MCF8417732.1 alginate export family protein [Melioribacteraceae bacterium]
MKRILITIIFSILFSIDLAAQINISAELRPRTEYRSGYSQLLSTDQSPAFVTTQRSRLAAGFKSGNIASKISFQDVRAWGDESLLSSTGAFGDQSSIDLNEAWISAFLTDHLSLKIGRQYFSYDDERLIAKRNWNQSSIKYDAVLISYFSTQSKMDLGFSYNSDNDNKFNNFYPSQKFKTFNFLHYTNSFSGNFNFSLLALLTGTTPNDTANTIYLKGTYGFNIDYQSSFGDFKFSAYLQNGKNKSSNDVSAYLVSAEISKAFSPVDVFTGATLLSGNDYTNSDPEYRSKDHAFDILWGARHKYYGSMDYFSNLSKATKGAGLADFYFKCRWEISRTFSSQIDYLYFATQFNIIDQNNNANVLEKYLASEIDISASLKPNDTIKIEGGYSILFPSGSFKTTQLGGLNSRSTQSWIWIMLTTNFDFQITN